ncbi:MAG TPA: class I SAM-dependent methyltransferase [bacterium]|nr:class I SAM-dependent methyltransferase [bacterium]
MTVPRGQCRFCGKALRHTFVDLGSQPLANRYLEPAQLAEMEPFYPLHLYVCEACLLVQIEEIVSPVEIFTDYPYFSSYSESWLAHARAFTGEAVERFRLGPDSRVVEVASNDGYLLQYFRDRGIPVLGVDPAANVAQVAVARGIPTLVRFFGAQTARELAAGGQAADLLIGNNVLAHVPDLNDFVEGLKLALRPRGAIVMEFPHLMRLMAETQFDTIYHEHFSYFSLRTVSEVFRAHGLRIFDVEELPTHGGSLRIFAQHEASEAHPPSERVPDLLQRERRAGLDALGTYLAFGERVRRVKRHLLTFLIGVKEAGQSVVGYAAAAKGNTLLNFCGIRDDFIDYVADRSPHKQGRYLPGSHIPIVAPERIRETKPDVVLILAWNLRDEVMEQLQYVREWGGRFAVPMPEPEVVA